MSSDINQVIGAYILTEMCIGPTCVSISYENFKNV